MPKSIFIDTNVFLDAFLPKDKKPCSLNLLNSIRMGQVQAFTSDYVLAEVLGRLKEEKEIGEKYYTTLNENEVLFIIEQLSKKYNLSTPRITFRGRVRHICYWYSDHISFTGKPVHLGVLLHEFAHYIESRLNNNKRHDEALMNRIRELHKIVILP